MDSIWCGLELVASGCDSAGIPFPVMKGGGADVDPSLLRQLEINTRRDLTLQQCADFYDTISVEANSPDPEKVCRPACWGQTPNGQVLIFVVDPTAHFGQRLLDKEERSLWVQGCVNRFYFPGVEYMEDMDQDLLNDWIARGDLFTIHHYMQGAIGALIENIEPFLAAMACACNSADQKCLQADTEARAAQARQGQPKPTPEEAAARVAKRAWEAAMKAKVQSTPALKEPAFLPEPKRQNRPFTIPCPCCARSIPASKNESQFICKLCDCGVEVCVRCGLNKLAHPDIEDGSPEKVRARKKFCQTQRPALWI
jgi:hypothetical protein